jgi:endoglycosylceramidase
MSTNASLRVKVISVLILALLIPLTALSFRPVSAQPQGFLSVKKTSIVDATGQPVILRGVNYPGYSGSEPTFHSEYIYEGIAEDGFNVVRLPISWSNLEPSPGVFNLVYFYEFVNQDVKWAKENGLYIILDMHQYNWADKFGGTGIPDWAVQQYPATAAGKQAAISNFWVNNTLQEQLAQVWLTIAEIYANEPTIAGYDILNEPTFYIYNNQGANASSITQFYTKILNTIRPVDQKHIVFLEQANTNLPSVPFANIVWSPHFYALSTVSEYYHDNITILASALAEDYQTFVVGMRTPMWIGEFGGFMTDGSQLTYLKDATTLFNEYQIGWAYWPNSGQAGITIPYVLTSS